MSGFATAASSSSTPCRHSVGTSKRKITYAPGTAPPREARVALSIPKFENSASGVTTYLIDVWQSGMCWLVRRRYKEFVNLHVRLVGELTKYGYVLPPLPKKRWFEAMRWTNRNDINYTDERRFGLELYLRMILRTPQVLDRSQAIRNFLNLSKFPADAFDVEEFDYQKHKHQFIRYYEIDDGEFVENNIYHTEDDEDESEVDEEEGERYSAVFTASAVDGKREKRHDYEALLLAELSGTAEVVGSPNTELGHVADADDFDSGDELDMSNNSSIDPNATGPTSTRKSQSLSLDAATDSLMPTSAAFAGLSLGMNDDATSGDKPRTLSEGHRTTWMVALDALKSCGPLPEAVNSQENPISSGDEHKQDIPSPWQNVSYDPTPGNKSTGANNNSLGVASVSKELPRKVGLNRVTVQGDHDPLLGPK